MATITTNHLPTTNQGRRIAPAPLPFDGVLCFGGVDWWYHNRGHYDLQMMREISRDLPVLYVNSIGMRRHRPTEGAMFARRVLRKLRSVRRGLVEARDNFWVMSALAAPGRLGRTVSSLALPRQVRAGLKTAGISRPLVWIACPPAARYFDQFDHAGLVYQRTDRFEAFGGVDEDEILALDRRLKQRADLSLFCSRELYAGESIHCRRAALVDHGVDFDRFAQAGRAADAGRAGPPADVAALPRPRVGFIGGIDRHTFDPALFLDVARRLPNVHFVLVGACSLPAGWCRLANVSLLGQKPYEQVADYMAACDVLVMPWNNSEWIRACNPVKLKEYLAVGRPVVSTPFAELEHYRGLVSVAPTAAAFARAIREALADPGDSGPRRERVRDETWRAKAERVLELLMDCEGSEAARGGREAAAAGASQLQ